MTSLSLAQPIFVEVKRSKFRDNQSRYLKQAKGKSVLVISSYDQEEEKLVLDRKYFEDLLTHLRSMIETLNITSDQELFSQILRAAGTLEEDTRLGKLHSFEEVFGDD